MSGPAQHRSCGQGPSFRRSHSALRRPRIGKLPWSLLTIETSINY